MTKKTTQPKLDPQIEQLKSDISRLESALARALADYANLERRFGLESSAVVKFANSSLLGKLLDIRDHLGLASTQIKDPGLTMIMSELDKLLVEEGVTQIKTDAGFDPASMECHEQANGPEGQIVKVVRPGYRLHDRVLRTARVVVGDGTVPKESGLEGSVQPAGKV
jgi:molecular chaperone GrpE